MGFASVFADIAKTKRGALPEEAFIHTGEMTVMTEIQEREDMRWVIYTDLQSSILLIENSRKNHQIYEILAKLYNQGKHITLCKVLAYAKDDHDKTTL